MRPDVGASNPAIMRSVVVFPHPLGPRSVRNSPRAVSSVRSATATTPPSKRFVSDSSFSIGRSGPAAPADVLVPEAHPLRRLLLEQRPVERLGDDPLAGS